MVDSTKFPSLDNSLIIFIKYPKSGFVKTRLAKAIGKKNAASLYKLFVEATVKLTEDVNFNRIVFFTPANKEKAFKKWLGKDLFFFPQKGSNLGIRMSNAFKLAFNQGAKRVIVIGTDSPLIDNRLICKAFNHLKKKQCAIGPSLDGGYYLVGLSGTYKDIFNDIDWSTDKVFGQSLKKVKQLGLTWSLLDRHFDVDDTNGLILLDRRLQKELSTGIDLACSVKGKVLSN